MQRLPRPGVSLSREHPPWRRGHGSKQETVSCSGAAGTGHGPQGESRPLHVAGRKEKEAWVPEPNQGRVMLGTKATNVDTRGSQSNRHEGARDPEFLTLRERKYQHGW